MQVLLKAVIIGAGLGFFFGQLVGIRIVKLNKWQLSIFRNIWLSIFFGLIYLSLGSLFGLLLGFLGFLTNFWLGISIKNLNYIYIIFSSIFLIYFLLKWSKIKSEILKLGISLVSGYLIFLFMLKFTTYKLSLLLLPLFLFSPIISISMFKRRRKKEKGGLATPRLVVNSNINLKPYDTKTKILLIGVDGADWYAIEPLIKKGKLPNIAEMKENGFSAKVKTIMPTCSAMIWTAIATGKPPSEHGIVHWQKIVFPGLLPLPGEPSNILYPKDSGARKIVSFLIKRKVINVSPYTSQSRRCKAFWNILSDFDKKSATVGWIFSWPAEEVKGVNVSWYTYPFEEVTNQLQSFPSSSLKQRTYPEEFIKEIEPFIVTNKDLTKEELKRLSLPTTKADYMKGRFANQISPWYFSKDKTFFNITNFILEHYADLDLVSVLFSGIDATSHTYWPFLEEAKNAEKFKKQILSISNQPSFKEESKGFYKCIELYYQYIDGIIGKLLKKVDENWTIIVVSDHGFRYDSSGHSNAPCGIFIAYGNNIEKAEKTSEVSIYDITPTILYLLGLPLAEDLKGRVIKEAISKDFLKRCPLRIIDTYENDSFENRKKPPILPEEIEEGLKNKLRALGYID